MPPTHNSYRERILEQSRAKYAIPVDAAKRLIAEEESTIIRSAQEKAIIEGKGRGVTGSSPVAEKETSEPEPLI